MKGEAVMTWIETDDLIERLQLLMGKIVEYGEWHIGAIPIDEENDEEHEYRRLPHESEFKNLLSLYCNYSVIKAARELESYFSDDDKKNVYHFNIWKKRLKLGLELKEHQAIIDVLKENDAYSYLGGKVDIDLIENATVESEWVMHDYLLLASLLLVDLFTLLHNETQRVLDLYGIDDKADFITDMIRPTPVENEDANKEDSAWYEAKCTPSIFYNIILYSDKNKLVERLHQLIDGNKGANVGSVLYKAVEKGYIRNIPTQDEFKSEFQLIGSWTAIHKYAKPNQNNENALLNAVLKARNVTIFDGEDN